MKKKHARTLTLFSYDFRSAEYPATVVRTSTGQACMQFEARAHAARGQSADEAWNPVD